MFKNCKIVRSGKPAGDYHHVQQKRGDADFPVSSSMLREFKRCPSRWLGGYERPESKSLKYGALVDMLVLTPDHFNQVFVIRPDTYTDEKGVEKEWHHASKTCKQWLKDHSDMEVCTRAEMAEAELAADRLLKDERIKAMLVASDKQVWISGEWHDESGIIIPVKALLDFVPQNDSPFYKNIGDLKTSRNADPQAWTRQVFDHGYHIQAAFNLDLYRAAMPNEDRVNFCHIVQENYPPFEIGRRILSEQFIELGRASYVSALKLYAFCIRKGIWPGYDDTDESAQGWSICSPTPWMESEALFAPRMGETGPKPDDLPPEDENGDVTP